MIYNITFLKIKYSETIFLLIKSVDLQKYTFGLIDVEHNYVEPKRTQIKDLLTSNGYVYKR